MIYEFAYYKSPIGVLKICIVDKKLSSVQFIKPVTSILSIEQLVPSPTMLLCFNQLDLYFSDSAFSLSMPIALPTIISVFSHKVWSELLKIPIGETLTYKELANRIGYPNSARAVGSACRKNPILLFIPCHRIVCSNGSIGGYVAGLEQKKFLLAHENKKRAI